MFAFYYKTIIKKLAINLASFFNVSEQFVAIQIKECLINGGLRPGINILGRTPYLYGKTRGEEIREYLNNHLKITDYIIVDDDENMMPEQLSHFIRTDGYTGFNLHDFEKFEKMVENQFC